jgi:hypothetical protein
VRDGAGIEAAIAAKAGREDAGLAVLGNIFNQSSDDDRACRQISRADRVFVADGGLMSYGPMERGGVSAAVYIFMRHFMVTRIQVASA